MVEEQDLDLAAVVLVNDTGTRVDEVLGRETGARGNTSICREGERESAVLSHLEGWVLCASTYMFREGRRC